MPYWVSVSLVIIASFAAGLLIERVLFKPLYGSSIAAQTAASLGLFAILNSTAGFIWGYEPRAFPAPLEAHKGLLSGVVSGHAATMLAAALAVVLALSTFLRRTTLGLSIRAAAADKSTTSLLGINVPFVISIGAGISASIGAVAGILVAPVLFLEPSMMFSVLIYAMAASALGGLVSLVGAVLAGVGLGLAENLVASLVPVVGAELKQPLTIGAAVLMMAFGPVGRRLRRG